MKRTAIILTGLLLTVGGLVDTAAATAQAAPAASGTAVTRAASGVAAQSGVARQLAGVCGSHWDGAFPATTVRSGSIDTTDPSAVKLAQCYLNLSILDSNLAVDGRFGPATDAMVRRFQRANCGNVPPVDGIVGPDTWNRLRSVANSPNFAC